MRETSELTDLLDQTLPAIDRHLADRDLPFYHRALLASIKFTTHVLAVHEPGQEAATPGQMCDFVRTRFFSQLYLYVHSWYRDQYGNEVGDVAWMTDGFCGLAKRFPAFLFLFCF